MRGIEVAVQAEYLFPLMLSLGFYSATKNLFPEFIFAIFGIGTTLTTLGSPVIAVSALKTSSLCHESSIRRNAVKIAACVHLVLAILLLWILYPILSKQ